MMEVKSEKRKENSGCGTTVVGRPQGYIGRGRPQGSPLQGMLARAQASGESLRAQASGAHTGDVGAGAGKRRPYREMPMQWGIYFIVMLLVSCGLNAQEMINTGGANFLNVPTDARSAAMAGTGVALAENNGTVFHNAAAVFGSEVNRGGVTYSYTPWMRDFMEDYKLHTVAGYYKINSRHAVLAGFRYYGYPSITGSDETKLKPKEWALEVGYSYRVLKGLSVSATVRYIMSSLGAVDDCDGASTAAVDLGAFFHRGFDGDRGDWSVGAQLSNFGGKLSYLTSEESLPTALRVGVGGSYSFSEYHRVSLTGELVSRLEPSDVSGTSVSVGGEYVLMDMLALRGGYHYGDKEKADCSYASAGAGVMVHGATVDFAWLFGDKDCTFRNSWFVTLGYRF